MKKQNIFLILLIALLNSCTSEEHMIFNNVPMDGTLDKFVSELTNSGFIISDSTKKNEIVLSGEFLNKDCKIYVWGTSKANTVYKVMVELPGEVPDSLQYSFEEIRKLYSSKYGTGKTRYQQYRNPERFMFNEPGLKRQIRKGDRTKYTIDSGYITVQVQDGFISITYLDKMNNEIRKMELEEESKKDID
jgi:hypothetical protein